ncbi:MAG: lipopolysaccharide biosynthesis protein [Eggerthellaceae bacterium]|nr:lipopolysaccharide biosynthesis protein [Eggerthellaceae bacterium]
MDEQNDQNRNTPRPTRRKSAASYRRAKARIRDTGSILDAGRSRTGASESAQTAAKHSRNAKPKRVNPIRQLINNWFDRVMGAVSDGGLADQEEEYASGRTSRDFALNSIGQGAWGVVFPFLTIVVTQLAGVERAGMFSFAFVVANLLYIIGTYGVRTYQVSDLDEYHSFSDYQVNRFATCAAMIVVGFLFCKVLGYEGEMFTMCMGIFVYKAFDALGEVYEGRLQQVDKLYLGGASLAIRSVAAFALYAIVLFVTGDLGIAAIAMAIGAAASFLFITFPLTLLETPRSTPMTIHSVIELFKACFPVFLALFLYALIDNMPKFVMQGANLPYDDQLYFNALYFPAQAILITVQLIYRPLLVKMAQAWADESRRHRFDILIIGMVVLILAITVAGVLLMLWIGIPVMSFMYGFDFGPYTQLALIMLAAGGVTAVIDFLYQIITILRRQQVVLNLYLITFGFSLLVLILMTTMMQLEGAVVGYLIVMSILVILLVREYIVQRLKFSKPRSR